MAHVSNKGNKFTVLSPVKMPSEYIFKVISLLSLVSSVASVYTVKQPNIRALLQPNGIEFSYKKDDPSMSLVAYHFNNPNKPLVGVAASDYAADISQANSEGNYLYTEPNVQLKNGDKIHYWLFVQVGGHGYQLTDQVWVYSTETTTPRPTTTTAAKTTTTKGPTTSRGSTTPKEGGGGGSCDCPDSKQPKCEDFPCLIFEDNFDTFDLGTWEHEITAGGGGNWEFQYYGNNRSNSYVRNGKLHLKPTLAADKWGDDWPYNGVLDIWGSQPADQCTGQEWYGCRREAQGGNIVNPIQSARVRTHRSFNFRYGRLEVEAKMPRGDWIWPAIWLLPRHQSYGKWPASGEIDLMESRGNAEYYDGSGTNVGSNQIGSTLHYGPYWPENGWGFAHSSYNLPAGQSFADDFHRFRVDWTKDGMKFFVDDQEYLDVNNEDDGSYWSRGGWDQKLPEESNAWRDGGKDAPFDQDFYLIMNVAVGGTGGYFDDALQNRGYPKPWSDKSDQASRQFYDQRNVWLQTWPKDDERAMQINYVRVWKMSENDM